MNILKYSGKPTTDFGDKKSSRIIFMNQTVREITCLTGAGYRRTEKKAQLTEKNSVGCALILFVGLKCILYRDYTLIS